VCVHDALHHRERVAVRRDRQVPHALVVVLCLGVLPGLCQNKGAEKRRSAVKLMNICVYTGVKSYVYGIR
jgi:hypothetical protein